MHRQKALFRQPQVLIVLSYHFVWYYVTSCKWRYGDVIPSLTFRLDSLTNRKFSAFSWVFMFRKNDMKNFGSCQNNCGSGFHTFQKGPSKNSDFSHCESGFNLAVPNQEHPQDWTLASPDFHIPSPKKWVFKNTTWPVQREFGKIYRS